jgi:hypothetical protein
MLNRLRRMILRTSFKMIKASLAKTRLLILQIDKINLRKMRIR